MQNLSRSNAEESMGNGSEWQMVKEPREKMLAGGKVKKTNAMGVRREDGFTVIRDHSSREHTETFIARGYFGMFKFIASRWDQEKDIPKDKYIVYLHRIQPGWPKDEDANRNLIKYFSKDIESALLYFSLSPFYNDIPVKEVLFYINDYNETHKLVHAGEC